MTKKPHLRLIKSKEPEPEEIYEDTFSYGLVLEGSFTISSKDKDEVKELCRLGEDIVSHPDFKEELAQIVYDLVAERLEVSTEPPQAG